MPVKPWTLIVPAALLLGLSSLRTAAAPARNAGSSPPATVQLDCAPWDGPAFSLWIPAEGVGGPAHAWLHLKIWQDPRASMGRFTFPDSSLRSGKGLVTLVRHLRSPRDTRGPQQRGEALKGSVTFTRVSPTEDVLGELDLTSERNTRLQGRFRAGWVGGPARCG